MVVVSLTAKYISIEMRYGDHLRTYVNASVEWVETTAASRTDTIFNSGANSGALKSGRDDDSDDGGGVRRGTQSLEGATDCKLAAVRSLSVAAVQSRHASNRSQTVWSTATVEIDNVTGFGAGKINGQ